MILLPLLALLMAVQVTVACKCEEMFFELSMCPGDNTTGLLHFKYSFVGLTLLFNTKMTVGMKRM